MFLLSECSRRFFRVLKCSRFSKGFWILFFETMKSNCSFRLRKSIDTHGRMWNPLIGFFPQCNRGIHWTFSMIFSFFWDVFSGISLNYSKFKSRSYLVFFQRLFYYWREHFYVFRQNQCSWQRCQKLRFSAVRQRGWG